MDTQSPAIPANLTASAVSGTQVNLNWTASTDNVGVTGYLGTLPGRGLFNLHPGGYHHLGHSLQRYRFDHGSQLQLPRSRTDAAGNFSGYSTTASATTPDTQSPTAPANLAATPSGGSQVNLTWTTSTDNIAVTGYLVERCQDVACSTFTQIGTTNATNFVDLRLLPGTTYNYQVRATDAAGNLSPYSLIVAVTTGSPDNEAPTTPSNPVATAVSGTQITVNWTASTDNVAVTSYLVERSQGVGSTSFTQVAAPSGTSFNDTALTPATVYNYRVRAAMPPETSVATRCRHHHHPRYAVAHGSRRPTATPANASQINLSWTASTDNVGVTAYLIERCQGAGFQPSSPK